jgi:hypothetical protein
LFKSIKNKRFTLLFLKTILFLVVAYFFYLQISKLDFTLIFSIKVKDYFYLILAICFVPLNWLFEYLKWNNLLKFGEIHISKRGKQKSFMAGIITGFLSPNLLGNFIGRMYYFPRNERVKIIYLTQYSNASQFLPSVLFGLISVLIIGFPFQFGLKLNFLFSVLLIISFVFLFIIYFRLPKLVKFLFEKKKWFKAMKFKQISLFQMQQLLVSSLRHLTFSLQYLFVFIAFGVSFNFILLFLIWQVFLWSTLIPSLWFGKLFIRESIALIVLTQFVSNG